MVLPVVAQVGRTAHRELLEDFAVLGFDGGSVGFGFGALLAHKVCGFFEVGTVGFAPLVCNLDVAEQVSANLQHLGGGLVQLERSVGGLSKGEDLMTSFSCRKRVFSSVSFLS